MFYAGEAKETSPAIAIIFGIYAHLVGIFLLRNGKRGGNRKNIGDKNVKKFSGGKEAYYKMNGTRTLS